MVGPGDYLASWVTTLFAMRLEIVRFPTSFQCCVSPTWPPHLQNFNGQVCYWRSNWDLLTLGNSDSVYDVPLGLHSYLWDGGRSRLEIKVELHEGAVPLPTLLAFYSTRFVCSPLLSVWCDFYLVVLNSFLQGTRRTFRRRLGVWRYTTLTQVRKIDTPYLEIKQMELILCPALMVIGISASESKFILHFLFPFIFIGCLTVILMLRTWAVWNRNQRLTIILPIIYILFCTSGLIILVRYFNSITCKWNFNARSWCMIYCMVVVTPYPNFKGCFVTHAKQGIVFMWALLLVLGARKCECATQCHSSSDWKGL